MRVIINIRCVMSCRWEDTYVGGYVAADGVKFNIVYAYDLNCLPIVKERRIITRYRRPRALLYAQCLVGELFLPIPEN